MNLLDRVRMQCKLLRDKYPNVRVTPIFDPEMLDMFIDNSLSIDSDGVGLFNVLDTETTGLNEGVNELFMLTNYQILVSSDCRKFKIISKNTYYNRPAISIPKKYQDSANVSDEMIDNNQITKDVFLDLINTLSKGTTICHNAEFDRWFVRQLGKKFGLDSADSELSFSCSNREVNWRRYGYTSTSLYNILDSIGISIGDNWHNADSDVMTTIFGLFYPLLNTDDDKLDLDKGLISKIPYNPMEIIRDNNISQDVDVIAHNTAFDAKDKIKSYSLGNKRFQWIGSLKSWSIKVSIKEVPLVVKFLKEDIYGPSSSISPIINKVPRSHRYQ